jgi:hypothetical protein
MSNLENMKWIMHNEELHDLYSMLITEMMKSRKKILDGHSTHTRDKCIKNLPETLPEV